MNHTTKSITTLDASAAPCRYCFRSRLRRREVQGPVGPMAVVVIREDAQHVLEMVAVEDQEPIETLRTNGPHEPLRDPVGLRGAKRRANDLDPVTPEHLVKSR
jgi:hypothetical protein